MGPLAEDMGKRFTYAEYCTWGDDERWELIDGVPYNMTPAPATRHQRISSNIHLMISEFLRGKQCVPFYAPTDVVFDEHNVVQPDLLVVCDREKITEANIQGAPELELELWSIFEKEKTEAVNERYPGYITENS